MALVWKYKIGRNWYLAYHQSLGLRRKSLRTDNKQIAEMIRAKEENNLLLGKAGINTQPFKKIRFSKFVQEYLAFKSGQNKSANTIESYTYTFNSFGEFLQVDEWISKIGKRTIEDYIAHRFAQKRKNKTIRNECINLASAFKWAKQRGYLVSSPMEGVELPRRIKHPPDYLHEDEYLQLKKSITDRQWMDIIDFYLLTGARREEALHIDPARHVDLKGGIISIPQPKSGDYRTIPISPDLRPVLRRLMKNANGSLITYRSDSGIHTYTEDALSRRFKRTLASLGMRTSLHFHCLRHTFGTWLGMQGVGARHIQEAMGHNDPGSTRVYVHAVADAFKKDLQRLRLPVQKKKRAKK